MAIEAKGAASLSRAERVARIESMSKRSQQSETSAGAAAALASAAGQADRVYRRRQEQRYVCLLATEQSFYAGLHSDVFAQPANIAHTMNEYSLWQLQGTDPAVL